MTAAAESAATLMGRLCDGDAAAFQAFYDLCAPTLFSHLLRRTSERASAEGLLDEVFRELVARRPSYVPGADPIPWLHAIADAACERQLRRRRVELRASVLEDRWAA